MKFFYFDAVLGAYGLFDLAQADKTATSYRTVVVSHEKSKAEGIDGPEPVDIGSCDSVVFADQVKAFRQRRVWKYDFGANAFSEYRFDPAALNGIYGAKPTVVDGSQSDFKFADDDKIVEYSSYWSSGAGTYRQLDAALDARSVKVETTGWAHCRPGCAIYISQDREQGLGFNDSPRQAEQDAKRYSGFEGIWYARSVRGYVDFRAKRFRQVLVLMRNSMS